MPSIDGRKNQATMPDQGNVADISVTDPTEEGTMIALLKGIIEQLQGGGGVASDVNVTDRPARDLGKVDIAGIDAVGTIAGQKAMIVSIPVVVASDQSDVNVNLNTALSASIDSIDVAKMTKGGVFTAHDTIVVTATSAEIDCRGYNGISVEMACSDFVSGSWTAEVLGCAISGGTFGQVYDSGLGRMITQVVSANGTITFTFKGTPNYVKILATRTIDGTLTCKITQMNL